MPTFNLRNPSDFFNYGANWEDELKNKSGDVLSSIGLGNLSGYTRIANEGIYGQDGLDQINAEADRASAFRRRSLAESMNRRGSRGVGPRSGAVDTFLANRVYAPSFAGDAERRANLIKENLASRLKGLEGRERTAELIKYFKELQDSEGGGWLDTVLGVGGLGLDIAGLFGVGVPGQGSAAKSATRPNSEF